MLVTVGTIIGFCVACFAVMSLLRGSNKFNVAGQTAIVTGGSQGLGLSVAKQLAAKGANVVIVAQTVSKLDTALKEIESLAINDQQRFLYLSKDLRSPASAPGILENVTKWNERPPDVVFNCAGNCLPGFFASSSIENLRAQMDTVYWTCAYMAHATLGAWTTPTKARSKQSRHLVFVSSTLAFFPVAGYSPYSPAKAAMRSLADSLNQEVAVYNGSRLHSEIGPEREIKIHIAFPMGIKSPGYENEQKMKPQLTRKLEESDKPQDPDELAKDLITRLEHGQFMLTSGFVGNVMRGWAMGASQRTSVMDYIWGWLGSLIVLFITPDFLSKCRKWGETKGLDSTR